MKLILSTLYYRISARQRPPGGAGAGGGRGESGHLPAGGRLEGRGQPRAPGLRRARLDQGGNNFVMITIDYLSISDNSLTLFWDWHNCIRQQ